jgi:phage head maturation protease
MSVGFQPTRSSWQYASDWNPDLGSDHMDHVVRHEARLVEVSLTATPAYVGARVDSVQSESISE